MTDTNKTFWNGEPAKAKRVRVIVGPPPKPTWWCAHLEGEEIDAVEVTVDQSPPFYLENATGEGWRKVTEGRGSPTWSHSSVPVLRVVGGPKRDPELTSPYGDNNPPV